MSQLILCLIILLVKFNRLTDAKWVEGHIKTKENWAFLSRFCFLSLDGQFEYMIEFDHSVGTPSLLLYYDDDSQWPSVYHSDKSCKQREAVLNKAGKNQIIPLSYFYPEQELSGCVIRNHFKELPAVKKPTKKPQPNTTESPKNVTKMDASYYDQFLKTTDMASTEMSFYAATDISENVTETLWEPIEDEINVNDSDIKTNLNDAEILFDSGDKKESNRARRSFAIYEKLKKRRLNSDHYGGGGDHPNGSKYVITCHNSRRFRSARERWWFIAISNCDSNQGLDVKYKFLMTNGPPNDFWHEHFSADEFYVLPVLLTFAFAYVFILVAVTLCTVELRSRHLLHSTYKLFVASTVLQEIGIIILSCAYAKYGLTGVENNKSRIVGNFFFGLSEMAYLLLLVLMAKGYTITRARLKVNFTVKLTVFMCAYAVTYIVLFVYQAKAFDPGEVLYLYESPAGYGLIVLRILAWFMFVYATVFTIKKYPEKGIFYCPFSVCGTMWFFAGPLFILTANYHIDKWVRESVVAAVLLFITFSAHVAFLVLTLPVFANKNFPYHVRTTQIGIMHVVDKFPRGPYQPSNQAEPVIIPLSKRTEELIGTICNKYLPKLSPPIANTRKFTANGSAPRTNMADNEIKMAAMENDSIETVTNDLKKESAVSKIENLNSNDVAVNANRIPEPKPRNLSKNLSTETTVSDDSKTDVFIIDSTPDKSNVIGLNAEESVNKIENAAQLILNPIAKPRRAILEPINLPSWSLAKSTNENISDKTSRNIEPALLPTVTSTMKKMPAVKNGFKQNSGDITTIIEGREHFLGVPMARASTLDLFNAVKKVT